MSEVFWVAGQLDDPLDDLGGRAFYTATETAKLLRLDESTLYRHLRRGAFPAMKIGGRYVVPAAVISRLVADVLSSGTCVDVRAWMDQKALEDARGAPTPTGNAPMHRVGDA